MPDRCVGLREREKKSDTANAIVESMPRNIGP
jgi:hypothetical protein